MIKQTTLKSISMATAMAAALAFGGAVHAQTAPTPTTNDSKQPQPATGGSAKTAEERTDAKMMKKPNKMDKMTKKGTTPSEAGSNAGASKLNDNSLPKSRGDGNGKS